MLTKKDLLTENAHLKKENKRLKNQISLQNIMFLELQVEFTHVSSKLEMLEKAKCDYLFKVKLLIAKMKQRKVNKILLQNN